MTEILRLTVFEAPALLREFLGTWSILVCLAGAYNLIAAVIQRKLRFCIGAMPLWILGMILLQVIRTVADRGAFGAFAGWKVLTWLLLLAVLTVIALSLTYESIRWRKTHITPLSIQESFEKLTEGLCYYRIGGQCILVNARMQELCRKITGHTLLNGEEFENTVFSLEGSIPKLEHVGADEEKTHSCLLPAGDQVFLIVARETSFEGESVREIVASDVSELYRKTEELREETERLKGFQEELQRYHARMQENVRREEILRAKMNIHDEMNRLLLSTRNAIASGDCADQQAALLLWKSNALLLCKETEGSTGVADAQHDLQVIAKSLGVELVMIGSLDIQREEALRLFVVVTREAMNNAVKHAGAKHVYVQVSREGDFLHATYTNDGGEPDPARTSKPLEQTKRVSGKPEREQGGANGWDGSGASQGNCLETGGLKNMRQKLEEAGGHMEITTDQGFRLEIMIQA